MTPLPLAADGRNGNAPDRIQTLAIGSREAHHHREVPIAGAFVQIAGALAADGGLDHGIDVPGRQSIARGPHPIDIDADGRLSERTKHGEIGDARHFGEHRGNCVGGFFQRLQIVAVDLDRIFALHARCRLFDVVLDVLREIEVDAGKLLLQRLRHLAA